MKTDALIDLLAVGAGPAPRAVVARRLAPAMLFGLLASGALSLALFGPVPDLSLPGAALWVKLAYAASLAAAAGWLAGRLSRPGAPSGRAMLAVAGVATAMAVVGALATLGVQPDRRLADALGHSWALCPFAVLGLSLPALAVVLRAMRGLAPTRPRAAGLAAGLLAGALGAGGYAFACTESSVVFVALWYTLGIAACGGLGAALGPRLLRW